MLVLRGDARLSRGQYGVMNGVLLSKKLREALHVSGIGCTYGQPFAPASLPSYFDLLRWCFPAVDAGLRGTKSM